MYAAASLHAEFSESELEILAQSTEGFSYSDIEQAIKGLAEEMVFGHLASPDAKTLLSRFKMTVPISQANEEIERIRTWGREHAQLASFGG